MTKRFLIFIPFHNPWNWHTDYTNQTATLLSRHHTVFCFLWGDAVSLREIIIDKSPYRPIQRYGRLFRYQPLYLIPGKRILSVQFINLFLNLVAAYILCSIMIFRQKKTFLFWFFGIYDPVFLLLPAFFRYSRLLYDCVDTPSHPDHRMTARLTEAEKQILRRAWIVTVNSKVLLTRLSKLRQDVRLVPLGFRQEMFTRPQTYLLPFSQKKPVIGYTGAIDYRINFSLLSRLVAANTQWQFALIGPVFHDHMSAQTIRLMEQTLRRKNVHHVKVNPRAIPSILAQCDVTIIPYRDALPFNKKSFPMKIMEYLYAGKPVITSRIDELAAYHPVVRFADTRTKWEQTISEALRKPLGLSEKRRAKSIASSHTWNKKVATLLHLLQTTPAHG